MASICFVLRRTLPVSWSFLRSRLAMPQAYLTIPWARIRSLWSGQPETGKFSTARRASGRAVVGLGGDLDVPHGVLFDPEFRHGHTALQGRRRGRPATG